jgi:hypothetical protein
VNANDDPIADIRQLRHRISEEFQHDPKLYILYLQKMHDKYLKQTRLYVELPITSPTGSRSIGGDCAGSRKPQMPTRTG